MPGVRLAGRLGCSEAALVTSERSGVVTRAAFPETVRDFGRISQCKASDEERYCRPRTILTVATAGTVAIERTRTL